MDSQFIEILKKHSGKTVDEVVALYTEQKKLEDLREQERLDNLKKYDESLYRKYFIINFNNVSFTIVYLSKPFEKCKEETEYEVYNIFRGHDFRIQKENRKIRHNWFLNPYRKYGYGGKPVVGIKEITKEEYKKIVLKCEEIINTIKEFDLK